MLSSDQLARNIDSGQFITTGKGGRHSPPPAWDRTSKGHKKSAMGSVSAISNGEGTANSSQEEHPEGSTRPFAMLVRLTPEIIEELKHAEAPRMKFGDNAGGHVIEVGPETFKFSSAPEAGDVCYIYAEQIDENGKHILGEVGSTWRKLSVQRILSSREKGQHTAEAETKQKLEKSVLVDQNTQLSIPQVALAEVDNRRAVLGMGKEPPPKKRKVTKSLLPSVHKQFYATDQIGNQCISSLSPERMSAVVKETPETALRAFPCSKGWPTTGGEAFHPFLSKARSTQKERALTTSMSAGSNINITDIRNLLISLLQETPKGMTIKALEKAVTEGLAVSPGRKLIEKIIKSIATFHAPGKYILNPGVEKGTFVDATIGSSGKSNETSCVETIEEKPFPNSMVEAIFQKEINLDLPKASHNKSHNSPANENISPQPVDSHIINEFVGKSPRNGAMDAKAIASTGSDSSSTNESDSESGTGSATSASESSSDSESDVSTSNSDPSMDEDVDIMSDGEDEMRSDVIHQKSKGEDVNLQVKEASKLRDDFENTEEIDSETLEKHNASLEIQSIFPGEVWPPEDTKVKERECTDDSLLETVFGPDKDADVMLNSHVLLKDDNLKNSSILSNDPSFGVSLFSQTPLDKQTDSLSEMPECNEAQGHNNQEKRKRNGSDRSTSLSHMEARAEKRAKQLDILVDEICEDKDVVSDSSWCVKLGPHQTTYQSPSCKVFEMVKKNEPDQHSTKQEARQPANGNSNPNGDNLSSKNSCLSLEASTENFAGPSLKSKDSLKKVRRPSREADGVDKLQSKHQSSIKPDKLITANQRKKHGKEADKHNAIRARSSECNERVASQVTSTSSRPDERSKFTRSLQNTTKELPGKDVHSKEEVSKSSMHKRRNSGETLPRQVTSLKVQQCPRKDADANKPTVRSFTRESGNVQDALELGRIIKDTSQRNSLEWAERTSSVEEPVERPKKDAGLSKQGADYAREDGFVAGLKARPPNDGMLSSIPSKEGTTMETGNIDSGHSSRTGHALSRSSFHESKRYDSQDLELGEFREPLSENELVESKRPSVRSKKHCFDATSRATSNLKSVSPDSKRQPPLSRRRLEASPAQGENNILLELHSQERITQDVQRAEPYRPLKKNQGTGQSKQRLGADRVKQSQHGRSVSTSKDLGGRTRSGGSDLKSHMTGSKETSRKHSNKLLGDSNTSTCSQQKARNAIFFPENKKPREDHRVKDLRISCKKQTPQSSEVHGGEFFALYEKEEPELRGAIYSLDQFRDYHQEFNEKYPIYTQLNASLENDKENFEMFRKDIEEAKRRGDMVKLAVIHGMVRKEYIQCHKRSKRMRHTFKVLHEELQVIKQQCKDYARKSRRRWC